MDADKVKVTLSPTFGVALSTVFTIPTFALQSSDKKVACVVFSTPQSGSVTVYSTIVVPIPVKVKTFPTNVAGPETNE